MDDLDPSFSFDDGDHRDGNKSMANKQANKIKFTNENDISEISIASDESGREDQSDGEEIFTEELYQKALEAERKD